jgi:tRNA (cmo5U34)-methyltransferase
MTRPLWKIPAIAVRERRHPPGRIRIPEPMVMNDPDSVAEFHAGGARSPGMRAVYDFNARALHALLPENGRLLDLGGGSGRALSAILHRRPDVRATAVDLSPNMLAAAEELFDKEGIGHQVELVEADITALPDGVTTTRWDAVSCIWTLHHLPDSNDLRATLCQIAALRHHGAAIWIFDFQRMRDPAAYPTLLDATYSALYAAMFPSLRKDGIASEAAAFTLAELKAELSSAGIGSVRSGISRPLPYLQAHWLPHVSGQPNIRSQTRSQRLGGAGHDALRLRWGFSAKPF